MKQDRRGFLKLFGISTAAVDAGFFTLDIPLIIEQGLFFALDVIGEPIHPCGKITGWAVFKGLHAVGIQ
jgi:hypothetical protein